MKSKKDLCFCIVTEKGIIGEYIPSLEGTPHQAEHFAPFTTLSYRAAQRVARRLMNISKVKHAVSILDIDSGAVLKV